MGDLFDDLYAPRATRYGDDLATEHTADALPDRHGAPYHFATGCRCVDCVAGCERRKAAAYDGRARDRARPWDRPDIEPALTYDDWKVARSA